MSTLMLTSMVAADTIILDPTAGTNPLAVVWLHGMSCKPEHYKALAQEFQKEAAASGYKAWVGIPEFIFDAPEPILIDHYVQDTIAELKKRGFTGDKIFLAAHSLGGVMAQDYVLKNKDIKGQILMGSTLLRNKRVI
jgi:alpha-beta hydrolase superfamily lysophospholipase